MKRIYTKPELLCEEYELSVAIAGDCGDSWDRSMFTHLDVNVCGYEIGGEIMFSTGIESRCVDRYPVDKPGSSYCYNTVADQMRVFAS